MNVIGKILTATTPATETQTVNIAHASASSATARPFVYSKNHCWQYDIRLNNREQDLLDAGLTEEEAATIKVGDLSFRYVDKTETAMCKRIVQFIRRHEWLGTMPLHPTHRFVAEYKGQLAGVIILSTPNAFSKLLGEGTKDLERLISRGACVSWSPKNTASKLLMDAIDWMVTNTQFRLFSCYADPEAREIGQIYQACNFVYLGQRYGGGKMYFDPTNRKRGYFTDRSFRSRSAWKRYAKVLGIGWEPEWQSGETVYWDRMPVDVASELRAYSKAEQERCEYRVMPRKHKYAMIRGKDRRETKQLMRRLTQLKPKLVGLAYPKREVSEMPEEAKAVAV
jgi:hypothetical protein